MFFGYIPLCSNILFVNSSDVWSFGVTLWEIFSNGEYPYCDIGEDEVVARRVRQGGGKGLRLSQPDSCPDKVMELMTACWAEDREMRPTFGQLKLRLQDVRMELAIEAVVAAAAAAAAAATAAAAAAAAAAATAATTAAATVATVATRPVSFGYGGIRKTKNIINLIVIGNECKSHYLIAYVFFIVISILTYYNFFKSVHVTPSLLIEKTLARRRCQSASVPRHSTHCLLSPLGLITSALMSFSLARQEEQQQDEQVEM